MATQTSFIFYPEIWGNDPIWQLRIFLTKGWQKPPTRIDNMQWSPGGHSRERIQGTIFHTWRSFMKKIGKGAGCARGLFLYTTWIYLGEGKKKSPSSQCYQLYFRILSAPKSWCGYQAIRILWGSDSWDSDSWWFNLSRRFHLRRPQERGEESRPWPGRSADLKLVDIIEILDARIRQYIIWGTLELFTVHVLRHIVWSHQPVTWWVAL